MKTMTIFTIAVILIAMGIITFSYKPGPDDKELASKRTAIPEYIRKITV